MPPLEAVKVVPLLAFPSQVTTVGVGEVVDEVLVEEVLIDEELVDVMLVDEATVLEEEDPAATFLAVQTYETLAGVPSEFFM